MKHSTLFQHITALIAKKHMLTHPFYQCWQAGKLAKEELQEYMKQYYHLESAFPRFISGIHSNVEDPSARQIILNSLNQEEGLMTNHVSQLLRFCVGLNLSQEEVEAAVCNEYTAQSIAAFFQIARDQNSLKGIAAFVAYKEQICDVAKTKIEGLRQYYDISDDATLQFFQTHTRRDRNWHELLDQKATTDSYDVILESATRARDALWTFLDGVTTEAILERVGKIQERS